MKRENGQIGGAKEMSNCIADDIEYERYFVSDMMSLNHFKHTDNQI